MSDYIRKRALKRALLKRAKSHDSGSWNYGRDPGEGLFGVQMEMYNSSAKMKAARCTRRAGKTVLCTREIIKALRKPNANIVYINETAPECRKVMWDSEDGLPRTLERLGVDHKVNNSTMKVTTPWGANVYLVGADKKGIEKLRGPKYDLVIFDEAQKFGDLDYAVREVIRPALLDKKGTLILAGTPSKFPSGLFYEVTRDGTKRSDWEAFNWSIRDNPYMPEDTWDDIIAALYAEGKDESDAGFRREFLGEWVLEDSKFCVNVHNLGDRIFYRNLPDGIDWHYTVGIDLGYSDYFAYVVLAWHPRRPEIYEVESFKKSQLNTDEQRDIVDKITKQYQAYAYVDAGGGTKSLVTAWMNRGLWVYEAKKHTQPKEASYGDVNSDFKRGRLLVLEHSDLIKQMREVQWAKNSSSGRPFEDPKFENDVLDAFIYAYNQCKHWCYRPEQALPEPGSKEYIKMKEEEYITKLENGEVSASKTKRFELRGKRLGSYKTKLTN